MGFLRQVSVSIRSDEMTAEMRELIALARDLKDNYSLGRCANVSVDVVEDYDRVAIDVDIEVFRSDIGHFYDARRFMDKARELGFAVEDNLVKSDKGYYEKEPDSWI